MGVDGKETGRHLGQWTVFQCSLERLVQRSRNRLRPKRPSCYLDAAISTRGLPDALGHCVSGTRSTVRTAACLGLDWRGPRHEQSPVVRDRVEGGVWNSSFHLPRSLLLVTHPPLGPVEKHAHPCPCRCLVLHPPSEFPTLAGSSSKTPRGCMKPQHGFLVPVDTDRSPSTSS